MRTKILLGAVLMALALATASAQEKMTFKLSHQGVLSDAKGAPVADGSYAITFKLYEVASGGEALWSEERNVPVSKGVFNLLLGEMKALNLPFDKSYWLGVTIGAGEELSPRMELTASAYSLHAKTIADDAVSTSKIQDGAITLNKIAANGAAPGQVLTVTPEGRVAWQSLAVSDSKLSVVNGSSESSGVADHLPWVASVATGGSAIAITNTGAGESIAGITNSTAGSAFGIRGLVSSAAPGAFSAGVRGINNGTGGNGVGVYGSQAGSGWGVYGTTPSGKGVYGVSTSSNGVHGTSTSEIGVLGTHTSNTGIDPGVRGETASINGDAVGTLGIILSTTPGAFSAGVRGINNGTGGLGIGVYGSQAGSGWGVYGTTANTGIGVYGASPNGIGVQGSHNATSGQNPGVRGETASISADAVGTLGIVTATSPGAFSAGVRGINNGTSSLGIGVYGSHALGGWGVYGTSVAGRGVYGFSKTGYGVFGRHDSTSGINAGVHGETASIQANAVGVYGIGTSTATARILGVYGQSNAVTGVGVHGFTPSTTGASYGVHGSSASASGIGALGEHLATTGTTAGVRGATSSTSASAVGVQGVVVSSTPGGTSAGVRGINNGTGTLGIGVYGSQAGGGWGVYGTAVSGRGVYAYATGTIGTNYGLYARTASASGWAGYFDGRVNIVGNCTVTGTLSKGGGSFKIDHPLDPANKYLYHSFVESPDMMNIYNGNVVLDGNGEAWVEMPQWFNALNRDFRYQLTAIGAPGPNLYVAEEIQSNRFKISGGKAGSKVSWQVTGVRQDAFAEKYRIPVEENKPMAERGRFLHPEVFGQPATMSVEAAYQTAEQAETPEPKNEQ